MTPATPHFTATAHVAITIGAALTVAPPIPPALRQALVETFTILNPLYRDALRYDRSTRGLDAYLTYYRGTAAGGLVLPRGAAEAIFALCQEHGVQPRWTDTTHVAPPVTFAERIALSTPQGAAVKQALSRRMGVLEAPAGSGKTCMALVVIARRRQPALWIVHTMELANQARVQASKILGLDAATIGFIGDGRCTVGERLTIGLVQSLARGIPRELLKVGFVIVDEAHHVPAEQMAAVVAQFPASHLLGLTATPFRRDGLDAAIGYYLGPVVARMDRLALTDRLIRPVVTKRETGCQPDGDTFTTLVSQLVTDPARNALITRDVADAARRGRRCLVLSDRVDHVETLTALLRAAGVRAEALHGHMPKKERAGVVAALNSGDLPVVVATGQLVGEGFDCPRLDALFLATPLSYVGRTEQYLGRISRTAVGKQDAQVYDYVDAHPVFYASWGKRGRLYRRLCTFAPPARGRESVA